MSTLAIQVDGIGKQYQLGMREKSHQTFREAVVDLAAAPFRRLKRLSGRSNGVDIFWALRDICFDVPEGEVLGIIGHNGAGKSTLLKILSRITEPTEGRAIVHGRVSSLLEVGTGFHPELSGRENVYLNGAILGMSRAEIDRKFEEIVDFAGVEQFLDTPIKRYSSGMKVRLAFAVAAHLEPEVLIIDEVLAVGDQAFQNKCLGKMNDVARSGRTVLFVSHNMAAVEALCSRVLFLRHGELVADSTPANVIGKYLQSRSTTSAHHDVDLVSHPERETAASELVMRRLRMTSLDGTPVEMVSVGGSIQVHLDLLSPTCIPDAAVCISLYDHVGTRVSTFHTDYQMDSFGSLEGHVTVSCTLRNCRLAPGTYSIAVYVSSRGDVVDRLKEATCLAISSSDVYCTGKSLPRKAGIYIPEVSWSRHLSIAESEIAV